MSKSNEQLTAIGIKKALQSSCRYKISAIALDKKGDILGTSINRSRFVRKGGGIHAEMNLMSRYGNIIKTILIYRTNAKGDLLPIHPCTFCAQKASELGIKIISVDDDSREQTNN